MPFFNIFCSVANCTKIGNMFLCIFVAYFEIDFHFAAF